MSRSTLGGLSQMAGFARAQRSLGMLPRPHFADGGPATTGASQVNPYTLTYNPLTGNVLTYGYGGEHLFFTPSTPPTTPTTPTTPPTPTPDTDTTPTVPNPLDVGGRSTYSTDYNRQRSEARDIPSYTNFGDWAAAVAQGWGLAGTLGSPLGMGLALGRSAITGEPPIGVKDGRLTGTLFGGLGVLSDRMQDSGNAAPHIDQKAVEDYKRAHTPIEVTKLDRNGNPVGGTSVSSGSGGHPVGYSDTGSSRTFNGWSNTSDMAGSSGGWTNPGPDTHNQTNNYGSSNSDNLRRGGLARMARGGTAVVRGMTRPRYGSGGLSRGAALVNGPGGGQDDLVPADLPQDSYVIPADVSAHLGDGNPLEGARRLTGALGKVPPSPSGGLRKGMVSAMVSPAEQVVGPGAVSSIGGGSAARGAKRLDGMVSAVRRHKAKAKGLPPKAKSPQQYMREGGRR